MHKILAFIACTLLLGCSERSPQATAPVVPPDTIILTNAIVISTAAWSGDGQTGGVGDDLPSRLAVRVLADGIPASGVMVHWATYWGDLNPDSSRTDASGIATTKWTASTTVGPGDATASIRAGNPPRPVTAARFTANSLPGPPSVISRLSAESQSLPVNSRQTFSQLRLSTTDRYGNPLTNGIVTWTVVEGPVQLYSIYAASQTAASTITAGLSVNVRKLDATGTAVVRATLINTNASALFTLNVTSPEFVVSIMEHDDDGVPFFFSDQNASVVPAVDTVNVGSMVVWKNRMYWDAYLPGGAPQYRVTSVGEPSFPTSPGLGHNAEYRYTFTVPGTYQYSDPRYPATMKGTLVVR